MSYGPRGEPDFESIAADRDEQRRPTVTQMEDRYERHLHGDDR